MSSISPRSVKGIRKTVEKPGDSGILLTDPILGPISTASTTWIVVMTNEERYTVRVPGYDGRISYGRNPSRGGADVRFYPNQTTKNYVAVMADVLTVIKSGVSVLKAPKSAAEMEREKLAEEIEKVRIEKVTEAIVKRTFAEEEF